MSYYLFAKPTMQIPRAFYMKIVISLCDLPPWITWTSVQSRLEGNKSIELTILTFSYECITKTNDIQDTRKVL
jgi:hypothetical protein